MQPETLYQQIGRIIENVPDFSFDSSLTNDHFIWLGRARALIAASGDMFATVKFDSASKRLNGMFKHDAFQEIMLVLHIVLGAAELAAPPSVRGSFIPAGNSFDAFAAVSKVLRPATNDILIVDPYMDDSILTDFGGSVPDGVTLRLLSDQSAVKPSLEPAAKRWVAQHSASRKLHVRLAAAKALHDRAIFVDSTTAWILTQSLKDFAKRSPAEIVRADDTAALKVGAYEAIWQKATVII